MQRPGLAPSIGWVGKAVVNGLESPQTGLIEIQPDKGWMVEALFSLLRALEIVGKPVGPWVEARLVIALQNSDLQQRAQQGATDDAAPLLYGAAEISVVLTLVWSRDGGLAQDMRPVEFVVTMVKLSLFVNPLSTLGKVTMHSAQAGPALACAVGLAPQRNAGSTAALRVG
jgi:hypothetical protein